MYERATDGLRLAVFFADQLTARRRFREVADVISEEGRETLRVRRVNGAELIGHTDTGGRIIFGSIRTAADRMRALDLDAVYLEGCHLEDDGELSASIAFLKSPVAEVISC